MGNIEKKVSGLPPELQQEVEDFIDFLSQRRTKGRKGRPTFAWAGALRDLRDRYSSVELQHQASEWMAEDA